MLPPRASVPIRLAAKSRAGGSRQVVHSYHVSHTGVTLCNTTRFDAKQAARIEPKFGDHKM